MARAAAPAGAARFTLPGRRGRDGVDYLRCIRARYLSTSLVIRDAARGAKRQRSRCGAAPGRQGPEAKGAGYGKSWRSSMKRKCRWFFDTNGTLASKAVAAIRESAIWSP